MTTIKNLPLISDLISMEKIPQDFFLFNGSSSSILQKIHFKNLVVSQGDYKETGFYDVTLVLFNEFGLDIPGTNGMELIINPGLEQVSGTNSEFNINFHYKWDILKYRHNFDLSGFDDSIEQVFNLALDLLQIRKEDFFLSFLDLFFTGDEQLQNFIEDFNLNSGQSFDLSLDEGLNNFLDQINNLIYQIEENGLNLFNILFSNYINVNVFDETISTINDLIRSTTDEISLDKIKEFLRPSAELSIKTIDLGLKIPRKIVKPVFTSYDDYPDAPEDFNIGDELPDPFHTMLRFTIGPVSYNTKTGFNFDTMGDFRFPKSYLGNSKFTVDVEGLEIDLSRENNISAATMDGRPADFIGAYISEGIIGFPTNWGHDDPELPSTSTAELFVNNMLIGTGGISGTIGMRLQATEDPEEQEDESPNGLLQLKFGQNFKVSLNKFDLTFQQNAIVESNIKGQLEIPGFKDEEGNPAIIDIDIHIGQDGEFSLVASSEEPAIKKIRVPHAFDFDIHSAFIGREKGEDGRFYLGVSGELDITAEGGIGKFLPDKLDIKKMLIYDDGTFEFEGGKIVLPRAYELKFGPATLSITGIHMGSHEQDRRKYKYFGFDGGVSTNPGGVDAQGKGLKFYYTVDDIEPFKWFIRLESLSVDIILPSGTDPEKAAVIIHGFLSIAEPKLPVPPTTLSPAELDRLKNSQEYIGGVSVKLPKFRGLEGSAAMRMNPKIPSFIIDLGIEMKQPIPLGATGLGIYGFRGLLGKNYVAEKSAADIPEDGEWWQYYKAKIAPDNKEGIQVSKFNTKNGFSLGAGVSLATASDAGKTFSSKLFFMLSLPDVFLFQGQAQFLKERIGLDANPDPPFFAIIAITNQSIEAGFGVNYKLRDNGKLVTVDGVVELGFFWGNSAAWYVNIGRETPEDRRIQARVFDILNMYFYLMMSSGGMRLGAGVKFELEKKFGPLSAELKAYIDTYGRISKRPKQIGGAIKMGGKVGLKVCGFGFSVSGGATLAAEASMPHIITGEFEVCVTVLKKERCARFEFTWNFNNALDTSAVPLLVNTIEGTNDADLSDAKRVAGMTHMVTKERFPVKAVVLNNSETESATGLGSIPHPLSLLSDMGPIWEPVVNTDNFRVPVDSFFDIDFKKGMNVNPALTNNLGKIGGQSSPAQYVEYIPPIRGKSDRVRHEYYLEDITIAYWDEIAEEWKPYDFYNAMLPIPIAPASDGGTSPFDTEALEAAKWGYWQQQAPGINNKLRILATTPLSYTAGNSDAYNIEDMGINGSTILCPGEEIPATCITFDTTDVASIFPAGNLSNYKDILFRTVNKDGVVAAVSFDTFDQGLFVSTGDTLELYFPEPMWSVSLRVNTTSTEVTAKFYRRKFTENDVNGLPLYEYELIDTMVKEDDFVEALFYEVETEAFDLVTITPGTCNVIQPAILVTMSVNQSMFGTTLTPDATEIMESIGDFLGTLIDNHHLDDSVELYPDHGTEYADFFGSVLYPSVPEEGDVVTLTQQHIGPLSLSFILSNIKGVICSYSFEAVSLPDGFSFDQITGVKAITPNTSDVTLGINKSLLVDFDVNISGTIYTARFILITCKPISVGFDPCNFSLYKLCYLSYANHLLNETLVNSSDQQTANNAMLDAISGTVQPIWRPNTKFAIGVKTVDKVYREGESDPLKKYYNHTVFGFQTAGPIGHFHQYPTDITMDATQRHDYAALVENSKGDQFQLKSLKSYIDYTKSYPNADGDLSNAKPLFYTNAKLQLFYLYNHVYYFYNNWLDYDHPVITPENTEPNYIANSSLDIRILNPAPSTNPETTHESGFVANSIDHDSEPGTPPNLIHSINSDISLLNNLLVNGNPCSTHDPVSPIDISSRLRMDLKPLKLYTAQFFAKYNPRINGEFSEDGFESLVHSYVFQTSRYSDFEEQVKSYVLKGTYENPEKVAVYSIDCSDDLDLELTERVIREQLLETDERLRNQHADRFDRLINGVLALDAKTLQAPVTTEFNLVKSNGNIIGILIRNPEPFNNPRMDIADPEVSSMEEMETLMVSAAPLPPDYFYVIHSKDRSQSFVTLRDFSFDMDETANYQFHFRYKEFNGQTYSDTDVFVTIPFNN